MSESKDRKRGRFDEDTVKLLSDFVKQRPGNRLHVSDIGEFYQTYPQLNGIFAGRLTKVAASFPSLLAIKRSENGAQLLVIPQHDEPYDKRREIESKIQEDRLKDLSEAVDALVTFLQTQCEDGVLLSSSLHQFYSSYPQFNKIFDGKFKILAKKYGDRIIIETVKGQAAFRLNNEGVHPSKTTPQDQGQFSTEFGTVELVRADDCDDVLDNMITSTNPDNSWIVDVDIDEAVTLILLAIKDRTIVIHADSSSKSSKLKQLQALLENKNLAKVCFDSESLQRLLSRVVDARLTRVFDLETSMHILSPDAPKLLTLNDLMREYGITCVFSQESLRQSFSRDERRCLLALTRFAHYARVIFEKLWEDAYSRNKIESCFAASDRVCLRGMDLNIRDLDIELIRLRKVPFSDDLSQTSKLAPHLQSFKTTLAQAKRRLGLTQQRLPSNACYHYHVLTPGYCERAETCKYLHGIASEDVD